MRGILSRIIHQGVSELPSHFEQARDSILFNLRALQLVEHLKLEGSIPF
jgi:hypothetical protein